MNKTDAREQATLLFFEADSKSQSVGVTRSELDVAPDRYAGIILDAYQEHEPKIEELISGNTRGWSSDRLPAFDRAVLRMAITELVRSAEVPVGTVISESVQLCEKYSTEQSPRFINGVLGVVAHKVRGVELLRTQDQGEA